VKVSDHGDYIGYYDLKDQYNDYKGYSTGKRGLQKAKDFIKHLATVYELKADLKMSDISKAIEKCGLKAHTYCGMD
jgi:hypothetical protein